MGGSMDRDDLKCCGNCHYLKSVVIVKKCLNCDGMPYSVCKNWKYDGMSYDARKKERKEL